MLNTNNQELKNTQSKINTIYVFIDASNLWESQKAKGRFFDYKKLADYIKKKFEGTSIKVYYYSAYPAQGTRPYSLEGKHKFLTFLKLGLGFEVRKKKLKRISILTENGELIEEKGNMDVEITIDSLDLISKYSIAVFFTGDSDFLALITYLKKRDKNVYIFSSKNNVSQELRTGTNGYFDVLKIDDDIWGRELKHRPESSITS
jgi:uncharacterized LabA/DUF88 family protein